MIQRVSFGTKTPGSATISGRPFGQKVSECAFPRFGCFCHALETDRRAFDRRRLSGTINFPPPRLLRIPSPLHDKRIVRWVKFFTHVVLNGDGCFKFQTRPINAQRKNVRKRRRVSRCPSRHRIAARRCPLDSSVLRFSFAFLPVEDWFHPLAAPLRRAGLCATRFSRLSFAFSPRPEHVLPSLARLDLVRNLA